ncbi:hypothetical protein F0562_022591 [Nyssa sinensis]|uniref:Uncharacterized protein n=1 Tax=Nyssa sinensis TaxID=561372 RepID=A0A5J5BR02_9ASTE|nr:hypothetical protein F0562_022591 [Nyssa sinensis]
MGCLEFYWKQFMAAADLENLREAVVRRTGWIERCAVGDDGGLLMVHGVETVGANGGLFMVRHDFVEMKRLAVKLGF